MMDSECYNSFSRADFEKLINKLIIERDKLRADRDTWHTEYKASCINRVELTTERDAWEVAHRECAESYRAVIAERDAVIKEKDHWYKMFESEKAERESWRIEYEKSCVDRDELLREVNELEIDLETSKGDYVEMEKLNDSLHAKCDAIARQTWEKTRGGCDGYPRNNIGQSTGWCDFHDNTKCNGTFNQCPAMGEQQLTEDE